ncbi:unnamed protein product [Fraxinus pennsylvanica]|uniref:Uncharacterized protein n=1 Tax=Fraxinus pennsylvanica TaxID=56036 RepID=A0AAD1YZV8_9LAMI|nr:unnamed protein product [Fraxinus pennsylvanica]
MLTRASQYVSRTPDEKQGFLLLKNRVSPLQSYLGYSYSLRIFQNAFSSEISDKSPTANKQEKVEQDPQNLLPKLEFLSSIGVSGDHFQNIIVKNPFLLQRSLEKQLIPCYNFLKNIPLANKDIVGIMRNSARILGTNVEKMASNVDVLRRMGVPQSSILLVMLHHPSLVLVNCMKLKGRINDVMNLGFNPLRTTFVQAVHVLCGSNKEGWENKAKVYRKFGLSDSEIRLAFRSHPLCMRLSEEKIARGMDFFVNKMGLSPAILVQWPVALFYNFEKRIVPRCRVVKVLVDKGLVKEYTLMSILVRTEEQFLDKFVRKYDNVLPELKDKYYAGLISKHTIDLKF